VIPKLLLVTFIFTTSNALHTQAQEYLLSGKITNSKLEPLPYASIRIKELKTGTTADNNGAFSLQVEAGKYDLIVTMMGYKTQVITVAITKDYRQNIKLVR